MRAIVYDINTGEIIRVMSGAVPIENQNLDNTEALLTNEENNIPDSLLDKKVNVETREIVNDPNHDPPRTKSDIKADLEAGEITEREALLELLK